MRKLLNKNLTELLTNIQKQKEKAITYTYSEANYYANLSEIVSNVLVQLGITANYKGYKYLNYAIILILKDPSYLNALVKKLYPTIGEYFGTNPNTVERSISYAIYSMWYYAENNDNFKKELFGDCKKKPTNGELITAILAYIFIKD